MALALSDFDLSTKTVISMSLCKRRRWEVRVVDATKAVEYVVIEMMKREACRDQKRRSVCIRDEKVGGSRRARATIPTEDEDETRRRQVEEEERRRSRRR
ncbi:hypothetical protein V1478_011058 [Vespula squamosa]|uniref:Uncharacterized protein n=1 Tax=Vespula squamosa TaxID=30214 RepID=A0ABD2AG57_VESSQ